MKVDEAYGLVRDLISEKAFHAEIEKRKIKFNNLLDDDALAYLIVDELGRNLSPVMKIKDLTPEKAATFYAKIIGEPQTRQNGHGITTVDVADETGVCTLVVWNNHFSPKKGQGIKIINGIVKNEYGLEVSVGRWGTVQESDVSIEPKIENRFIPISDITPGTRDVSIRGKILGIFPTRTFTRKDGGTGFVASIQIGDESGMCFVVAWGDQVKLFKDLKEGKTIQIEHAYAKEGKGIEVHLRRSSILQIMD